jgi:hypothetical protein
VSLGIRSSLRVKLKMEDVPWKERDELDSMTPVSTTWFVPNILLYACE